MSRRRALRRQDCGWLKTSANKARPCRERACAAFPFSGMWLLRELFLEVASKGRSASSDEGRPRPESPFTVPLELISPSPAQTPHAMSMKKVALSSLDVAGKRVLIRVDFNVPQDKKDPSVITNTARCARAAPIAARHDCQRVRPDTSAPPPQHRRRHAHDQLLP